MVLDEDAKLAAKRVSSVLFLHGHSHRREKTYGRERLSLTADTVNDETEPVTASEEPVIYLITGPMAAGKTTVARLLAARFARGVHLEGDFFRRSIVRGRQKITPPLSPTALEQLRLRY
jgi:hypothetical protein